MNYVHIIGRLAKDPESRFTADNLKVTTLVVATSSFRAGNEETIWWRVTLWGDRWDKMISHLSKGKPVMIGGEMRKPSIYNDKGGSAQVGSIELTADYVKFLPFQKQDQAEGGGAAYGESANKKSGGFGGMASGVGEDAFGADHAEEEPLPF